MGWECASRSCTSEWLATGDGRVARAAGSAWEDGASMAGRLLGAAGDEKQVPTSGSFGLQVREPYYVGSRDTDPIAKKHIGMRSAPHHPCMAYRSKRPCESMDTRSTRR